MDENQLHSVQAFKRFFSERCFTGAIIFSFPFCSMRRLDDIPILVNFLCFLGYLDWYNTLP